MDFMLGYGNDDTSIVPTCTGRNRKVRELLRYTVVTLIAKGDELSCGIDGGGILVGEVIARTEIYDPVRWIALERNLIVRSF